MAWFTIVDAQTKAPDHDGRDAIVDRCFEKGLLILGCGENTIRHAMMDIVDAAIAAVLDGIAGFINGAGGGGQGPQSPAGGGRGAQGPQAFAGGDAGGGYGGAQVVYNSLTIHTDTETAKALEYHYDMMTSWSGATAT